MFIALVNRIEAMNYSTIHGSLDHLGRPLVRLRTSTNHELICIVDTGFNRCLLLTGEEARLAGFVPFNPKIFDNLRTVSMLPDEAAEVMRGTIKWFGEEKLVDAHVTRHDPAGRLDGSPLALIGTEMLRGSQLLIDFEELKVAILKKPIADNEARA